MSLFQDAENSMAYLKAGFLGFMGTGKTYTASQLAIGLHKHAKLTGKPVYFLDTETGSDWLIPVFKKAGIQLRVRKTRAFKDLVPAIQEAQKNNGILLIDSITHFWVELCTSYKTKRGKKFLSIADWGYLKDTWRAFTDEFVNSACHIIICGRAGYEFDTEVDEDGKKELIKTGVKMKVEGEFGFEPSLLVQMDREQNLQTNEVTRVAHILKDRSTLIDGKSFPNPTFASFKPHIESLNLGGTHVGVDASLNSESEFTDNGTPKWKYEQEQKVIVLDEIETLLVEHFPSTGKDDRAAKIAQLKDAFGTASWERIKTFGLEPLRAGYEHIRRELEPDAVVTQKYENGAADPNGHLPLEDDAVPQTFTAGTYPAVNFNEAGEEV